jgi:exodeoxyribonuclease VII small subunit
MIEISLDNLTFESALTELEKIVRELEDGQIGLEESLAHYEKGVTLLRKCYGQLQQAEQRIMLMKGIDGDNRPVTEPFEPATEPANHKPAQKKINNGDELF